jgi:hypothetical protein
MIYNKMTSENPSLYLKFSTSKFVLFTTHLHCRHQATVALEISKNFEVENSSQIFKLDPAV